MIFTLRRLLESKEGNIIVSVLLGFGLATLFRQVCKGRNCFLYHAPPLEEIEDKVYKHGEKCYKYSLEPTACDKSKKIVTFA